MVMGDHDARIPSRMALPAEQVPFYTLNYQLGADGTDLIRQT